MPATILDGLFGQAYASRRFQSTWMGVVTHTLPSFVIISLDLSLLLK